MEPTQMVLVVGAVLLIAGGIVLFVKRKPKVQEDASLYLRCPGCGRKLKYQPRQIGHQGKCSACKAPFTFPPPSQR